VRREGGAAVLSVRDNGVGIAEDVRDHLFEPFVQAPQTLERTPGGLGLGLAMVRGLAELHGGRVDVTSAGPGKGSEFLVRLPAVAPHLQVGPSNQMPESRRRRVLVIEDNLETCDTLRELLEIEGHDVQVAYDGPTGIELARDYRPEIVLCDIGLPRMNGYEWRAPCGPTKRSGACTSSR